MYVDSCKKLIYPTRPLEPAGAIFLLGLCLDLGETLDLLPCSAWTEKESVDSFLRRFLVRAPELTPECENTDLAYYIHLVVVYYN